MCERERVSETLFVVVGVSDNVEVGAAESDSENDKEKLSRGENDSDRPRVLDDERSAVADNDAVSSSVRDKECPLDFDSKIVTELKLPVLLADREMSTDAVNVSDDDGV